MLLTTKLFVPQLLEQHVPRPRLQVRLDAALATRLTLVSAPPGFGKSTLLAEWIDSLRVRQMGVDVAWVALDEHDDDPLRFYSHLVAALQRAGGMHGAELPLLSSGSQLPSSETLIAAIINSAAERATPLVLVLDDYHVLSNRELHRAIVYLIDNLPGQLHLVIATRANPPFPLARWRVQRALAEIREGDLRFRDDESEMFLQEAAGASLTPAQVAAIAQRTEGWIGALQLAALSLQETDDVGGFVARFTGSHAYIVDYLVQEVLNRQPEPVQRFLLRTSVLSRMCGSLCAALTGERASEAILHELHRQNLFTIALDEEHCWFRYHQLFADMLRARLRRTEAVDCTELYLAASRWCEENGSLGEAVQYALAGPDWPRVAELVERHYWSMLERSEFVQLRSWMEAMPASLFRNRPVLSLAKAWSLYATYRFAEIEARLPDAERGLTDARSDDSLRAEIITLRASSAMYAGESARAIALAKQALAADKEQRALLFCTNAIALGYSYNVSGKPRRSYEWAKAGWERGMAARLPFPAAENQEIMLLYLERVGSFEEGEAIIRKVLAAAGAGDVLAVFLSTSAHLFLSRYLLERCELETAAEHILLAQQQAARLGLEYVLIKCHIQLMFVRQAQGNWPEAHTHLTKMWELSAGFTGYYLQWHAALAAQACLLQGEVAEATAFMAQVDLRPTDLLTAANEPEASVLARLLYAQGRLDEALDVADRLRAVETALGRVRREMEMWCLRSLVLWQQRQTDEALAALAAALAIGARHRLLYALLAMPKLLHTLLRAYCDQAPAASNTGFARTLLTMAAGQALPPPAPANATTVAEPLSAREREVLCLVAAGLSDRQIAERLIVAPGTVKRHLNNLYGKLGVHSRTQAVAQARAAGIV